MTTRCKFVCESVLMSVMHGADKRKLYTATFRCVVSGSDENRAFFHYTPSGTLTIGVYTEDRFEPGEEYYLDIIPTPEAA